MQGGYVSYYTQYTALGTYIMGRVVGDQRTKRAQGMFLFQGGVYLVRLDTWSIYSCKSRITEKLKSWTRKTAGNNVIREKEPM